ncbi:hypothetical protein BFJ68_g17658 [Fusarium oxysporum]|uniref:SnoaL-like domain-containing protein n=1 Tax=Fusarium oxysporum TaxID=5507 RepID=A0A420NLG8_FUSOX|nr:hypothetical protein BFJ68_g17658 [Fusarium oxysporum]
MKCFAIFPLGLILGAARAINMTDYALTCGIDREFKRWYRELLGAFQDPTTTDSITSFFAPGGALILGGSNFTGGEAILAAEEQSCPLTDPSNGMCVPLCLLHAHGEPRILSADVELTALPQHYRCRFRDADK